MQQRASRSWPHLLGVVQLLALTLSSCSSGKASSDEVRQFTDGAGHVCEDRLAKTSPTAPPVSETVSCDGVGRQCSAESKSCFELNVDRDSFAIQNCPACCRGSASSFSSSDCSPVVCMTDADCVYRLAQCVDGACVCPQGFCD